MINQHADGSTPPDAEAVAREEVVMCYHPATFSEAEFLTRLDAYRAAVAEAVARRVRAEGDAQQVRWMDGQMQATNEAIASARENGRELREALGLPADAGYADIFAAIACLQEASAFVAALDAGEIVQFSGWGNAADPSKFGIRMRGAGATGFGFGPDVLTAFRAAQDHLGGGDGTL